MAVIGLDLGGTKLSGAWFDEQGNLSGKKTVLLEKRQGDDVGLLIVHEIHRLMEAADHKNDQITSIGISVPGICYSQSGEVWAPNIPGWEDFPLREFIHSSIKSRDVTITLDSDRSCSVLGEIWQGKARNCTDVIFLAVGTGIGAGIMANGNIITGVNGAAGAIGWMALDRPMKDEYISTGCFEYHASGAGIVNKTKTLLRETHFHDSALSSIPYHEINTPIIFEFAKKGDILASTVIKQAVEFWGMAAANLVSLYNPQYIIFGGGVFGPALEYLDNIHQEARKWAQPVSINQVIFEGSSLGSDAALFGAGKLAWKNNENKV